uniref:Transposase n=1 Tax=Acrobeloides nanus TaxID=290746 RepID=A0A914CMP6_9BILA
MEDLEDEARSGRPSTFNEDELRRLVEEDPKRTTRELAAILQKDKALVWRHLQAIGMINKFGVWVPYKLSDLNKGTRFVCASELLERHESGNLNLDLILTGDEKWVLYINVTRRREWVRRGENATPTAKAGLHPKKVLLCLWWDTEGVVHWELLAQGRTITAEVYCQQLDRLAEVLAEKRPHRQQHFLLHDNARPHTALLTQRKLAQLGWEALPHPPYSPDLAPTDYKAFRSLQHWLNGKEFATEEDVRKSIQEWIDSKSAGFWVKGIADLPNRWDKVIEYEGDYFPDD